MSTKDKILNDLQKGEFITCLDAFNKYNTLSLKGIIHVLRQQHDIRDLWCKGKTGKFYKKYFMGEPIRRIM